MEMASRFGIEVNFLTGRYVATSHNDRRRPEWPPHPARLFSALVATWADSDSPSQTERETLEWLEDLGAPGIVDETKAVPRKVVSHFVPVNDSAVVSRSWQHRLAQNKVYPTLKLLRAELAMSHGEVTRKVEQIQKRLAKQRDVSDQTSRIGPTSPSSAEQMFPESRRKQERHFPSMTLGLQEATSTSAPRVTYIWNHALPSDTSQVLDKLLSRLTRLGHSSSLVSCRVVTEEAPDAGLVPSRFGAATLRNVRRGQVAELERRHAQHRGIKPRALPFTDVRYQNADDVRDQDERGSTGCPNTAGNWIVFEFANDSRAFPSYRTVEVATALRAAIFSHAADPIPEGLSGHGPDGRPSADPHVAFLPLPYVGSPRGDGRLLGIAVSVPDAIDEAARRSLFRAVGAWEGQTKNAPKLVFGRRGEIVMKRLLGHGLWTLRREEWCGPSRRWVSVTPIALPRHPGRLRGGTGAARVKAWKATEVALRTTTSHVGLPEPLETQSSLNPFLTGARPTHQFPPFHQLGRHDKPVRRQLVHAALTFEHPVRGPLVLGAGRFLGLGLMRPVRDADG